MKTCSLCGVFFGLLLSTPTLLLFQQSAVAEEPLSSAAEITVVESRAHYSFTLPHSDLVQSGASQHVRIEYNRPNSVARDRIDHDRILSETHQPDQDNPGQTVSVIGNDKVY